MTQQELELMLDLAREVERSLVSITHLNKFPRFLLSEFVSIKKMGFKKYD